MSADQPCVAAVGVFDGVHLGHQSLIRMARDRAIERGVPLTAVTFDPDPMAVIPGRQAPSHLAPLSRRCQLLEQAGADTVHVLNFDEAMSRMSPEDFVRDVLVGQIGAIDVVVGPDFRYGHRAAGTVTSLEKDGQALGFDVCIAGMVGDEADRWSSTRIRAQVEAGDVEAAARGLGRPYSIDGVVVHGDHRGRELGYPTANITWDDHPAVPADGVYAGFLLDASVRWPAAISVGTNPQFDGRERRVEAYALDRDDLDLYGHEVRIDFVRRLRGQLVFGSVGELMDQMAEDVAESRSLLTQ